MKRYLIRDKECGNPITEADTLQEAKQIIKDFEKEDVIEKNYTPDFYEIYDLVEEKIEEVED